MFFTKRFFYIFTCLTILLGLGYVYPLVFSLSKILWGLLLSVTIIDFVLLYHRKGINADRHCRDRFSNGDPNRVNIRLENSYPFTVESTIIDEAPPIFQRRDISYVLSIAAKDEAQLNYDLVPVKRGVYSFGKIRCFVRTKVCLVERRFSEGKPIDVKVYPSYLMLNQYELMAMSNQITELGMKRIRRVGNNTEFEQIKDYVPGDDYRKINWKATARRSHLMVNVFINERSQQIVSVIDKGRVMQQSFAGMTFLDYSINASLVLSYIAMHREDKAGLVTFSNDIDTFIAPTRRRGQMQNILDSLYNQRSNFVETDFSNLCLNLRQQLTKRSLIVLYTNFTTMTALNRQINYLRLLSKWHRVVVVFFRDTELEDYAKSEKKTTEDYYRHVIADKIENEKKLMAARLQQYGIYCILTKPEDLSVNVINKYLELKHRQLIS